MQYQSVPQFNSVLATRLGNGDVTLDVFDTDMPRTSAYAARGWLADVSDVFGDLSTQIDPGSIGASTVDGKLVAMPSQTSENILYYNRKLLKAAVSSLASSSLVRTAAGNWRPSVVSSRS